MIILIFFYFPYKNPPQLEQFTSDNYLATFNSTKHLSGTLAIAAIVNS